MPSYNILQLTADLSAAQAALNSGDQNGALMNIANYYAAQESFRGYATDAYQVVMKQGAYGIIANQLVATAAGANYPDIQATLAYNLAVADFNIVQQNLSSVPTESQIEAYHAQAFQDLGLPITAWGGAAFAALGLNWGVGLTPAETAGGHASVFTNLGFSDTLQAIGNLEKAVIQSGPAAASDSAGSIQAAESFLELTTAFSGKYVPAEAFSPIDFAGITNDGFSNGLFYTDYSAGSISDPNSITTRATFNTNESGTVTTTQKGLTTEQTFATTAQEYGEVGATFGSSLGRILAGSNAFAQISASTVLGALGEQIAAAIGVAGAGADATTTLDTFLDGDRTAGPNGGLIGNGGFLDSLESQGAGAVGAYLVGELVSALGLTGAPAQVVDSFAGQAVAQIADNIIESGFSAWADGLGAAADLEGVAGALIGTELGNLVYSTSTVQGQEGASVGSAVGGAIGSIIEPGLGTAIGAFVGDIIGGLVGDAFGESSISAISLASVSPDSASGALLQYGFSPSLYQGGSLATANSVGDAVTGSLNSILTEVGGTVSNAASLTQFTVGVNTDSSIGQVFYYDDNTNGVRTEYVANDTSLQTVVDYSVIHELSEMLFTGGDPYVERAIDAALRSSATPDMETVSGDVQIAEDYETYEANKTVTGGSDDTTYGGGGSDTYELNAAGELKLGARIPFNDNRKASNPLKYAVS